MEKENCYLVRLIPMKKSDEKRVRKANKIPLNRFLISESQQINEIKKFVQNLINDTSCNITIHAQINGKFSQVPLSLFFGELVLMCPPDFVSIKREVELRYSFSKIDEHPAVAAPQEYYEQTETLQNSPQIPKNPLPAPTYQPPPMIVIPPQQTDTIGLDVTFAQPPSLMSGFSICSESFGDQISPIRPQKSTEGESANTSQDPRAASLKNSLEQLMRKK